MKTTCRPKMNLQSTIMLGDADIRFHCNHLDGGSDVACQTVNVYQSYNMSHAYVDVLSLYYSVERRCPYCRVSFNGPAVHVHVCIY